MDDKLMVEAMKREAESNPASKVALKSFCQRKRPRSTLTLVGLEHRLQAEGYDFPKSDYVSLLTALANVGFGELTRDHKGNISGLKSIKKTFESLGDAVTKEGAPPELVSFKLRPKFTRVAYKKQYAAPLAPKPQVLTVEAPRGLTVNLEVSINGKSVHIPVPNELTNEDIMTLISRLKVS